MSPLKSNCTANSNIYSLLLIHCLLLLICHCHDHAYAPNPCSKSPCVKPPKRVMRMRYPKSLTPSPAVAIRTLSQSPSFQSQSSRKDAIDDPPLPPSSPPSPGTDHISTLKVSSHKCTYEHNMERIRSVEARMGMLGARSKEVDEAVGEVIGVGGLAISRFGKQMRGNWESGSVSMSALSNKATYWSSSPASLIK